MRRGIFGVISLLMTGICACGSAPAPGAAQPHPVEIAAPVATATATAAAGPDLSAVAEPPDIVGIGRWRSPITTASNLASCAGIAPVIVEVNARMGVDLLLRQVLRTSIDTRRLAALISLDAPVDIVVVLDPQAKPRPPLVAVAVGLSTLDGAKIAIAPDGQPQELVPGVWKVKGERGAACGVAASAGQTPARLVCADREKTLTALAPYLARTAPGLDLGGPDVHVEARVDVARKRYGDSLQGFLQSMPGAVAAEYGVGDQRFDRLLFESATAAQEDASKFLNDLSRVTAEVRSARSGTCLRANADLDLSGKTSWLAGTLTERLDRSGPPPAIYWRQPKDSEMAIYSRGADATRFAGVLPKARDLVEASLAAEGFGTPADRKKLADLIDMPFGKDTNMVMSRGALAVPLPPATGKGGQQKLIEAFWTRMLGWTLVGVDEGPAAMKKQLKALVDAYKLPGVQSALKKEMGTHDAKMLPVIKSGTAPAALGAGAEALELTISNLEVPPSPDAPDAKSPGTMSLKAHVLLMADGDTTWLAVGGSKDDLVKKLTSVKSGASDREQLATRAGLDSLRNGKQMAGGFVSAAPVAGTVSTIIQTIEASEPGTFSSQQISLGSSLGSLPNRGQTPLLITWNGTAGATPKLSLAIEAQQGTFEDARSLAMSAYGFFSSLGILP